MLLGRFGGEVGGEDGDVVAARAQRRQHERHDVQAEEKIAAEAAFGGLLFEVAVAGGDESYVHVDRLRAAEPLERALLQDAQEFDLHDGAQLADLVEKERAAVGQLKAAFLGLRRGGERAALVPE